MIVIVGIIIVMAAVLGGFTMAGGHVGVLVHVSEFVVIGGAAIGSLVVMSPKKVLVDIFKGLMLTLKGAPYSRTSYDELLKVLYELFLLAKRDGMVALEEHVTNPKESALFAKYPEFHKNHHGVDFLCNALRPIVDGRVKPDQLRMLLDTELRTTEQEHHAPIGVITKVADALPGFGIVAAVLGIIITMGAISGPPEVIGHKVAAALVGTFLGILLSYGIVAPLATNLEFISVAEMAYLRAIATAVTSFAQGLAPVMAVEMARRGVGTDVRPTADEMETMLKQLSAARA